MTRWRQMLAQLDIRLFWYLHLRLARRWLDHAMRAVTLLGGVSPNLGACLGLILAGQPTRSVGYQALLALAGSHLLVQLLKHQVERPRPYLVLADSRVIVAPLSDYSFPSGHTTASFSMAVVLSAHWSALAPVLVPVAVLVGLSRMYLGHHYPSDVAAGAAIGTVFAYATLLGVRTYAGV